MKTKIVKKVNPVLFTEAEVQQIHSAVRRSWDYIAYDAVQLGGGSINREDAIEMAIDAGRPVEIGKLRPELYARLCKLSARELIAFFRPIFPHHRYGM